MSDFKQQLRKELQDRDYRDAYAEQFLNSALTAQLLTLRKERGLSPCVERVKPLLAFAFRPGVLGMHVDAIGAAIDLRGSHLHQLDQRRLQFGRFPYKRLQRGHGVISCGRNLVSF